MIIEINIKDLRQDMLTLQVMRIMDALWKSRDMDFCLSVYEVLPMGKNCSGVTMLGFGDVIDLYRGRELDSIDLFRG
ncbi:unnamed protein product, partial [Anisakis simplex]|uniref:Phosphatidylinositol 3-kinase age-1 (inferred by orthology to a C. elegans protein) n=1 Tax=Anisakis simplex TaxID=6269 RepID=A0A0M3KKQ1_ANISI